MTADPKLSAAGERLVAAVASLLQAGADASATLCAAGIHPPMRNREAGVPCQSCGRTVRPGYDDRLY